MKEPTEAADMKNAQEKGQSLTLYLAMLGVILGAAALAFDLSRAYSLKARMQHAADAAALAAAWELPYKQLAGAVAQDYAARNGFAHGVGDVAVNSFVHPTVSNWYVVEITNQTVHFLAPIIGKRRATVTVSSTAEYNTFVPMDINGGGEYGANGIMTLSVFGPYAYYTYGDPYSAKWLNNGSANPEYKSGGYNFSINVPSDYYSRNGTNTVKVEIFDPDTYNNGGDDAYPGVRVDEIRSAPPNPHPQPSNRRNTTVYSLYAPDDTPNDYSDDVLIASAEYGPDVSWTDMKWVSPSGFSVNINDYGTGNYRLNVTSANGSSENGFNLRAGPSGATFNPGNGTSINAVGALPINFNDKGVVTIRLGYVKPEAAGAKMHIGNFDTDVGSKSIIYRCDTLQGEWPGSLSSDGKWSFDSIDIPSAYAGGNWTATYTAGLQDTSVWRMWIEGVVEGQPGFVRLVN